MIPRQIRPLGLSHVQMPKRPGASTPSGSSTFTSKSTSASNSVANALASFAMQENSDDLLPQLRLAPMYDATDPAQTIRSLEQLLDTDHYRDKIVIMTFLRRFGCPVCRAVSTGLSYLKETVFDQLQDQVRLVAVSIENVGFEEFHRKQFFSGDVFVDSSGEVFRLLKMKKLGVSNAYGVAHLGKMKAAVALAMSSGGHYGDGTNFEGNLAQLGGMFIINGRRDHFLMEFREAYAGDTPYVADILKTIHAPTATIEPFQQQGKRVLELSQEALIAIRKRATELGLPDPTAPQTVLEAHGVKPRQVASEDSVDKTASVSEEDLAQHQKEWTEVNGGSDGAASS